MQPNDNSMDKNVNWKLQRFLKSMHNLNSSCCISQIQLRTDIREAVSASWDRSDIGCWQLQKSLWLFVSHLNYRAIPQEIFKLTWERCTAMKVKNNAEGCILGVTQRRAVQCGPCMFHSDVHNPVLYHCVVVDCCCFLIPMPPKCTCIQHKTEQLWWLLILLHKTWLSQGFQIKMAQSMPCSEHRTPQMLVLISSGLLCL